MALPHRLTKKAPPTGAFFTVKLPARFYLGPNMADSYRMLYLHLQLLADTKNCIFENDAELAQVARCSVRVIEYGLERLQELGYINIATYPTKPTRIITFTEL